MKALIVDKAKVRNNLQVIQTAAGDAQIYAVLKINAYGLGLKPMAELCREAGIRRFAVTEPEDAVRLRDWGFQEEEILILRSTACEEDIRAILKAGATATVGSYDAALALNGIAESEGVVCDVHIKVDTGMSRLGYLVDEKHFDTGTADICAACDLPGLRAEGIFTHFSVSDEPDADSRAYTERQLALFRRVIAAVEEKRGQRFAIRHCANSGGVACYPETYMDMVRPGILLYGCGPLAEELGLRPVMTLKTTVSTIKTYEPGTDISYGRLFTTPRVTRMGVVPYGYADGFFRCLSGKCAFAAKGGDAPQRGRICMDMSMVDLTDLPEVQVGDELEVFGAHHPVGELAALADTIPYELVCAVSRRVPRVYLQNGAEVERELLLRF